MTGSASRSKGRRGQSSANDEWSYPLHASGSISTLPAEHEDDVIRRLHEVVMEVTGKPVEQPQKHRIGFLP